MAEENEEHILPNQQLKIHNAIAERPVRRYYMQKYEAKTTYFCYIANDVALA